MVGLACRSSRENRLRKGRAAVAADQGDHGAQGRGNSRSREVLLSGTPATRRMDQRFAGRPAHQFAGAVRGKTTSHGEIAASGSKSARHAGGDWRGGVVWLREVLATRTICGMGELASGAQRRRSHLVWDRG